MAAVLDFPLLIGAFNNEIEIIEYNRLRKALRENSEPFDIPDAFFKKMYRCNKATARHLIAEISNFLPEPEKEAIAIPKPLVVLCALHFFAQGSYQKGVGTDTNCPMSQTSVSRCIELVTNILVENFNHKIKFPTTEEAKDDEKVKFANILNGFPGIIGAIDGTHIRIQAPPVEDEDFPGILFYNRKGYYSLNTQIICGADLKILAVNARYPGSVHDSAIWSTSVIRGHLIQNYINGDRSSWLIGDSGYPLEPWLMNPIMDGNMDEHGRAFNIRLRSVRNVIERVIGILKTRFRCCFSHRTLHYHPIKASKIIAACCILHNIFLEQGDMLEEENYVDQEPVNYDFVDGPNWLNEGRMTRDRIVREYF